MLAPVTLAACGDDDAESTSPSSIGSSTVAASSTSVPATQSGAFKLVQREIDLFNNGDIDGSVALFASDAVLVTRLGRCTPCVGRETIRGSWSRAIASATQLGVEAPKLDGETVTVASTLRAPGLPEGVDRAVGTAVFTIRDGQIIRLEQTYDLTDPQTATLFEVSGLTPTTVSS